MPLESHEYVAGKHTVNPLVSWRQKATNDRGAGNTGHDSRQCYQNQDVERRWKKVSWPQDLGYGDLLMRGMGIEWGWILGVNPGHRDIVGTSCQWKIQHGMVTGWYWRWYWSVHPGSVWTRTNHGLEFWNSIFPYFPYIPPHSLALTPLTARERPSVMFAVEVYVLGAISEIKPSDLVINDFESCRSIAMSLSLLSLPQSTALHWHNWQAPKRPRT